MKIEYLSSPNKPLKLFDLSKSNVRELYFKAAMINILTIDQTTTFNVKEVVE